MRTVTMWILFIAMAGFAVPKTLSQQRAPSGKAHLQQVYQRDVEADVVRGREALQNAKRQLEAAGGEWGGHRVAAMKHIDAALAELKLAEQWARQHKDIK
jgi:hypothetical protein